MAVWLTDDLELIILLMLLLPECLSLKKKSLQEFYTVLGSRAHLSQFYTGLAVDASLALSI